MKAVALCAAFVLVLACGAALTSASPHPRRKLGSHIRVHHKSAHDAALQKPRRTRLGTDNSDCSKDQLSQPQSVHAVLPTGDPSHWSLNTSWSLFFNNSLTVQILPSEFQQSTVFAYVARFPWNPNDNSYLVAADAKTGATIFQTQLPSSAPTNCLLYETADRVACIGATSYVILEAKTGDAVSIEAFPNNLTVGAGGLDNGELFLVEQNAAFFTLVSTVTNSEKFLLGVDIFPAVLNLTDAQLHLLEPVALENLTLNALWMNNARVLAPGNFTLDFTIYAQLPRVSGPNSDTCTRVNRYRAASNKSTATQLKLPVDVLNDQDSETKRHLRLQRHDR
jgi:hypothetical protein